MNLKVLVIGVTLTYVALFLMGDDLGLVMVHRLSKGDAGGLLTGAALYEFGSYFAPVMGGLLTLAGVALTIRHQKEESERADRRQAMLVEKSHRLTLRPAIKLSLMPLGGEARLGVPIRLCDPIVDGEIYAAYRVGVELLNANLAERIDISIIASTRNGRSTIASYEVLARQFERRDQLVTFGLPREGVEDLRAFCVVSFYDAEGNFYQRPYPLLVSRLNFEGEASLHVSLESGGRIRYIEKVASENLYMKIKGHFENEHELEVREQREREALAIVESQVPGCMRLLELALERHYSDTGSSFEEFLLKRGLDHGLSPAGAGFSGYSCVFADPPKRKLYATLTYSAVYSGDDGFSSKAVCWGHTVEIDIRTGRSVLISRRITVDEISCSQREMRGVRIKFASSGKSPFAPFAVWRYWTAR